MEATFRGGGKFGAFVPRLRNDLIEQREPVGIFRVRCKRSADMKRSVLEVAPHERLLCKRDILLRIQACSSSHLNSRRSCTGSSRRLAPFGAPLRATQGWPGKRLTGPKVPPLASQACRSEPCRQHGSAHVPPCAAPLSLSGLRHMARWRNRSTSDERARRTMLGTRGDEERKHDRRLRAV